MTFAVWYGGKKKKIKRKKEILRMVEKRPQQKMMPQRPKLHGRRPAMPEWEKTEDGLHLQQNEAQQMESVSRAANDEDGLTDW